MKGLHIQMIIEFNKQEDNYNIDFINKYIKEALKEAADYVFTKEYGDNFNEVFPESIRDKNVSLLTNVHFVDEETIQNLNLENRNINDITDVLSFPSKEMHNARFLSLEEFDFYPDLEDVEFSEDDSVGEDDENTALEEDINIEDIEDYILDLGDVVICVERALDQAEDYDHSYTRELTFLALHGFLHIIGFDHEESAEAEKLMFGIQEEILDKLEITREMEDEEDINLVDDSDEPEVLELENGPIIFSEEVEEELDPNFKAGYVAIIGRPNAGKSTLLNRLAGDKLAITSPKAKTTRHNIRTVLEDDSSQMIFIDTPGIEKSTNKLERYMASSAWNAFELADVVLLLVDGKRGGITEVEQTAIKRAKEYDLPIILLLTKTDISIKEKMLPIIAEYSEKFDITDIVPVSSVKDDNIDIVLDMVRERLPNQARIYSEGAYTDQSEKAIASEFIREEILNELYQEVPHDVAVRIEKFEEHNNNQGERSLIVIDAVILVSRSSQKGIIVGKGGKTIKKIGIKARQELEEVYEAKVFLELFVRVQDDWKNQNRILNELGYTEGRNGPAENDIIV